MEFEEKTTGIAENGAEFISTPERRGRGTTILAHGLRLKVILVSQGSRHNENKPMKNKKRRKTRRGEDADRGSRGGCAMVDKIGCERFDCWAATIRTPSPITRHKKSS